MFGLAQWSISEDCLAIHAHCSLRPRVVGRTGRHHARYAGHRSRARSRRCGAKLLARPGGARSASCGPTGSRASRTSTGRPRPGLTPDAAEGRADRRWYDEARRPRAERGRRPGPADRRRVLAVAVSSRGRSTSPAPRARTRATTRWPSRSREAHARNLEFHAWFNPYRVSMDTDRDALVPDAPGAGAPRLGRRATAASSTTTRASPQVRELVERRDHGRGRQVRHRRRALRRLLLPLPGGGPGVPRRRRPSPAVRRRLHRQGATGAATTSTC